MTTKEDRMPTPIAPSIAQTARDFETEEERTAYGEGVCDGITVACDAMERVAGAGEHARPFIEYVRALACVYRPGA